MGNEDKQEIKLNMKECPYCCKKIPKQAKKCQYCGEWLIDKKELRKENKIFYTFSAICFILFILFMLFYLASISNSAEQVVGMLIFFSIIAFIMYYLYFLPTVIATNRKHSNTTAIFLVNLIFGCTGIGWVVALILAVVEDKN